MSDSIFVRRSIFEIAASLNDCEINLFASRNCAFMEASFDYIEDANGNSFCPVMRVEEKEDGLRFLPYFDIFVAGINSGLSISDEKLKQFANGREIIEDYIRVVDVQDAIRLIHEIVPEMTKAILNASDEFEPMMIF